MQNKLNETRIIDYLGRVNIPKEIRKFMDWREDDVIEFSIGANNEVILKKVAETNN